MMINTRYQNISFPHSQLHCGYSKVYCLKDSHGIVFYIGTTHGSLTARLRGHLNEAAKFEGASNIMKNQIIIDNEFNITIHELERVWMTGPNGWSILEKSFPLEDKWILYYRSKGYGIVNKKIAIESKSSTKFIN